MRPHKVTEMLAKRVQRSGIDKKGACHILRHAAATEMSRNGANIRLLQEMLSHSSITSTEIYLHMTINDLQKAYFETHPAANGRHMHEF